MKTIAGLTLILHQRGGIRIPDGGIFFYSGKSQV